MSRKKGTFVRTFFGAVLILGAVAGFEWGVRVADVAGREVGGLVLAYGLGLAPLIVAMLLLEAAENVRSRWVVLVGVIPAWYVLYRWIPLVYLFGRAHDVAFVPALLLLVGVLAVLGWQASLWIRLRRKAVSMDVLARKETAAAEKQVSPGKADTGGGVSADEADGAAKVVEVKLVAMEAREYTVPKKSQEDVVTYDVPPGNNASSASDDEPSGDTPQGVEPAQPEET